LTTGRIAAAHGRFTCIL